MAGDLVEKRFRSLNKQCILHKVASNLMDVLKMSSSSTARTVNSWCGFTSILPLLVAPLVGFYWNRYSTILAFSYLYVVGILALISTALNKSNSSCLLVFGADQIETEDELPTNKPDKNPHKRRLFKNTGSCSAMRNTVILITIILLCFSNVKYCSGVSIGTASMIDPRYIPTNSTCYRSQVYNLPSDNFIAFASEGIWNQGSACGMRYSLHCLSGMNHKLCKDGNIIINALVVDVCLGRQCPTFQLSYEAFTAISRSRRGKVYIEYIM